MSNESASSMLHNKTRLGPAKRFFAMALLPLLATACQPPNGEEAPPPREPVGYIRGTLDKKGEAQISVGLVQIRQAIEFFTFSKERFPEDLEELITKGYLEKIPDLPYRKKFLYHPSTGEVSVVPSE